MCRRSLSTCIFILLPVILSAANAFSQERVVSLKEAIEQALIGNPELRANERALFAHKEDIGIARSILLPKLIFEERYMRTNNPTYAFMAKLNQERFSADDLAGAPDTFNDPDTLNDFQTSLSFEQALFAPKAYIGVDMAKKEYAAQGDNFERKKEEIALNVFRTFVGIQTAKEFVAVTEKGIENAQEHLRIAEARYKSDLGLYSDMLRAQVALSAEEEKNVSALKNLAIAKRALGLMMGLTEGVDVEGERPDLQVRRPEYYNGQALTRKDLKSLETRYRNAGNALKIANAGYLPVVGLGGSYQLNDHDGAFGDEGRSWQLIAFLRWELFDGTKREHEREKARQKIAEAGEYLDGLKKQISFFVFDAYLTVEEAKKRLELAEHALKSAEEGRRLVKTRYENALSAMVDLLDVQTHLDAARASVIQKEGEYLTAIANLGFQSGTILKDLEIGQ
ncbi:MAG: TolC family protein [Nitrospiraceae bacterium]|nr:MAG: TolC family protein [Nitrospiraceae bacterium]